MAVERADEHRHEATGERWSEWHRLAALGATGDLALVMQIGIERSRDRHAGTFHCVVLRAGLDPVVIVEQNVMPPARLWEFRASGLWAEAVCEEPYRHWSYGLEAFALSIDDPEEMLGRGYGVRVPLGWELEFESGSEPHRDGPGSYHQVGEVHGEVLFGDGSTPLAGPAVRRHVWGEHDGSPAPIDDRVIATGPVAAEIDDRTVTLPLSTAGRLLVGLAGNALIVGSGPQGR